MDMYNEPQANMTPKCQTTSEHYHVDFNSLEVRLKGS